MGLVLGICILHSPNSLRIQINQDEPPYTPVSQIKASDGDRPDAGITGFARNPVRFFKGRKPAWWAWWLVRAGSLVFVLIVFILLLNNFYVYRKTCTWCKYLSCLVCHFPLPPFSFHLSLLSLTDKLNSQSTIGARLETYNSHR